MISPTLFPAKKLRETQNAVEKQCNVLKFKSGLKHLYFTEKIFKDRHKNSGKDMSVLFLLLFFFWWGGHATVHVGS